jgi:hypothetical protein
VSPQRSPFSIDGPNCPQAVRLKEVGDMEIVLSILVVTLLVILPVLFLVLMLGGLVDAVRRAFFGSGHRDQTRPPV